MAWHVYSEVVDGRARTYENCPLATENVANIRGVEFSGCGCWATVYDGSKPIKVFMWMNGKPVERRKMGKGIDMGALGG